MKTDALHAAQLAYCEQMGYDCWKNGANEKNCHFSLFPTAEHTKAWERGKAKAERDARAAQGVKIKDGVAYHPGIRPLSEWTK